MIKRLFASTEDETLANIATLATLGIVCLLAAILIFIMP